VVDVWWICCPGLSGGWSSLLSALTSRASFATTARQWGLHHYLQHSATNNSSSDGTERLSDTETHTFACTAVDSITSTDDSGSSRKCSGQSRITGRSNGGWSSDTLAEMFEGLVGALLLDSDYQTVRRTLQPWAAEAFQLARAATRMSYPPADGREYRKGGGGGDCSPDSSSSSSNADSKGCCSSSSNADSKGCCSSSSNAVSKGCCSSSSNADSKGCCRTVLSSSSSSETTVSELEEQVRALLTWQLQQVCGYCFTNTNILDCCSQHVVLLITRGSSSSCRQAESWHFLGYSLLRFVAAQQAYCKFAQHLQLDDGGERLRQRPKVGQEAQPRLWAHQDSSAGGRGADARKGIQNSNSSAGRRNGGGNGSSNGSSSNLVQDMSRRMGHLITVRHRWV